MTDKRNCNWNNTGKHAYNEYSKVVGGKTWDDKPMPTWTALDGTKQQEAWIAACKKVVGLQ